MFCFTGVFMKDQWNNQQTSINMGQKVEAQMAQKAPTEATKENKDFNTITRKSPLA